MGFNITVYRQLDGGKAPATTDPIRAKPLAAWTADHRGLEWLDALAKEGKAIYLGGNYYPSHYTVMAGPAIEQITEKPPEGLTEWKRDFAELQAKDCSSQGAGIDRLAITQCAPDEWLQVVVWDRS